MRKGARAGGAPLEFIQRAQRIMGRFSSPEALKRIANKVEQQQDISIKK